MMENFLIALEIMGKGMGGIFVSILIIMDRITQGLGKQKKGK